jgi:hypothetical protein
MKPTTWHEAYNSTQGLQLGMKVYNSIGSLQLDMKSTTRHKAYNLTQSLQLGTKAYNSTRRPTTRHKAYNLAQRPTTSFLKALSSAPNSSTFPQFEPISARVELLFDFISIMCLITYIFHFYLYSIHIFLINFVVRRIYCRILS